MTQANFQSHYVGLGDYKRMIAVLHEEAPGTGHFWLGGFKSSMKGEKAEALAAFGREKGHAVTRFDYTGHGLSGGVFEEATLSDWLEEAVSVFESFTKGPQIVLGSSMGGWLALRLAQKLGPSRIKGMVLIAPAWDMTEKLMRARFTPEILWDIEEKGFYARPSAYGDGDYIITKKLIEDGENHLLAGSDIRLGLPVHILHGRDDPDVPWQHGHALTTLLPHDDVTFTLVPDGDHRLSRSQDIDLLLRAVERLHGA